MEHQAWLQRPIAILFTAFLAIYFPPKLVEQIAMGVLLAHYLAAVHYYPWAGLRRAGLLRPQVLLLLLAVVFSFLLFVFSLPSIVFYFGVHFVLTELYEGAGAGRPPALPISRAAYYGSFYLFVMRMHLGIDVLYWPLLGIFAASLVWVAARTCGWRERLSELGFLGAFCLAYPHEMRFSHVLIYHVALWWLIPLVRGYRIERAAFLRYNLALTAFFLLVVIGTVWWRPELHNWWLREVALFGYIHVTFSFLMSNLNPPAIRALAAFLRGKLAHAF